MSLLVVFTLKKNHLRKLKSEREGKKYSRKHGWLEMAKVFASGTYMTWTLTSLLKLSVNF